MTLLLTPDWSRFFYLFELKNIWWSVFCGYNRFHEFPSKIERHIGWVQRFVRFCYYAPQL